MNILIPHKWLLDHLKTKAKPQEIQKYLSLSGPSVENVDEIEGDQVYDIEITTNRVDAMSVRGVAREANVILNRYGIKTSLKNLNLPKTLTPEAEELPLPQINNNPELCNRILCVVLTNIEHTATPNWMAQRLTQAGFQVHDSAIDITNYITHDLGHPCHAFDYDKIMDLGGVINVTEAKAGRPFETLDGAKYEAIGGEIVFTNDVGTIIDLPAIIGTKNSSVDENTNQILLWIEDLDAQKVRQASMQHAIRTIAAQLNEKEVDPHLGKEVLFKAVSLYQKLTKAKVASKIYDDFPNPRRLEPVQINTQTIANYLGLELEVERIQQILTQLGCTVEIIQSESKDTTSTQLSVTPPTYRPDIQIPADVIEEIARIYGYQELPSILMSGQLPLNAPQEADFNLENRIKNFLADIGWQEVYTLSLISEAQAHWGALKPEDHLKLANPLLEDNVYLRRSLIPSLEAALQENPQAKNLSVFELAAVFHPREGELPEQPIKLGMLSRKNYREVRGDLEALLAQFYINNIKIKPEELTDQESKNGYQQKASILAKLKNQEHYLGFAFVLPNQEVGFELDCDMLIELARRYPQYQAPTKTSPIIEDLTFTLTPDTPVGRVIDQILAANELVRSVELKDVYQQNHTFTIKYQNLENNLSTEDVAPIRETIVERVEDGFNAKLVGQV
jgi:phenylalanyl-tRNA synthetase beta chain